MRAIIDFLSAPLALVVMITVIWKNITDCQLTQIRKKNEARNRLAATIDSQNSQRISMSKLLIRAEPWTVLVVTLGVFIASMGTILYLLHTAPSTPLTYREAALLAGLVAAAVITSRK